MKSMQRRTAKGRPRAIAALTIAAVLALSLAAFAAAEKPITVRAGNLIFTANGSVTPKALPKKEMAPIALNVSGKIATADGTHPPALVEAVVETDRNGTIDARGVATCKQGQLEATTTTAAEKACKASIVGTGTTDIQVEFPEQAPISIRSKLLALNGGTKGATTTIYIHAYLTSPVTAAVVTTVTVSKVKNGRYGIRSIASIPKIAGGAGAVTAFTLTFPKKLFAYQGQKHGYLLAKCADGHFDAEATVKFSDGTKVGPAKIVRACTPKG